MSYVIATRPGRSVHRASNDVQKYARVQTSGKFKFVTSVNDATIFDTASGLIRALGIRARTLKGNPTSDLTFAEVQQSGVTVTRIANGH